MFDLLFLERFPLEVRLTTKHCLNEGESFINIEGESFTSIYTRVYSTARLHMLSHLFL